MASKVMIKMPGQVQFPAMTVKSSVSVVAETPVAVVTDVLRVAQLEQSMRFIQEQHALMLSGLHSEIETLRQRNRDLQFQIVFSKGNQTTPPIDHSEDLKEAVERAEISTRVAEEARAEARAADTRASALQKQLDELTDRLRVVHVAKVQPKTATSPSESDTDPMCPAALKRRLVDAERLVRRLRCDGERQRREVHAGGAGGGVTNFLFDPRPDHIQSMRSPLTSPYVHAVPHQHPAAHARFPPLAPPARDFWQQQQAHQSEKKTLRERKSSTTSTYKEKSKPLPSPLPAIEPKSAPTNIRPLPGSAGSTNTASSSRSGGVTRPIWRSSTTTSPPTTSRAAVGATPTTDARAKTRMPSQTSVTKRPT